MRSETNMESRNDTVFGTHWTDHWVARLFATLDAARASLEQVTARCERLKKECEAWRAADDCAEDATFDANMRTTRSIGTVEKARRLRTQNVEAERG